MHAQILLRSVIASVRGACLTAMNGARQDVRSVHAVGGGNMRLVVKTESIFLSHARGLG